MSDVKEEGAENCKICSIPTRNKCSSCKTVSYCSKEHQSEDWKNHKDQCRPFQVKSSLELGKYLEATRDITGGDVLFSEVPIIVGPRPEDFVCLGCYSSTPENRCPHCFWPICSPSCPGLTNLDHHGSECTILRLYTRRVQSVCEISEDFFRYEAILPLRCLLLQRRNPKNWKILMEMESHSKKRGPNTEIFKQVQEKVVNYLQENFFIILDQIEKESGKEMKLIPDRSAEIIQRICGIIDVNALEIRLPNQDSLNGLYPTAYLMEHNCLPNTRHVFQCQPSKEFRIIVYANQDIQPGNHISTMYTHALWGTQQRQDHLRSTKYFTCRCRRCGDPSELGTNLSALRCLAPGVEHKICGGNQLPIAPLDLATEWKCDKCPTSLTSAQVAELVNMIGREVDHAQENQPTVESLQIILEKLRKLLHKNHYHCYSVMHSLIQLYGRQPGYLMEEMNDLLIQKKMKMCRELLTITQAIDPTASRLSLYSSVIEQELASAILTLCKRKSWTGNELTNKLEEARSLLTHALKSLEPEEESSPGGRVSKVIASDLNELEAFCRNHIILEYNFTKKSKERRRQKPKKKPTNALLLANKKLNSFNSENAKERYLERRDTSKQMQARKPLKYVASFFKEILTVKFLEIFRKLLLMMDFKIVQDLKEIILVLDTNFSNFR